MAREFFEKPSPSASPEFPPEPGVSEVPPVYEKLALITGDKRVLDGILNQIGAKWAELNLHEQRNLELLLRNLYDALEGYQGKFRRFKAVASSFQKDMDAKDEGFYEVDAMRHNLHEVVADALNALSRNMKEMGMSNAWRANDAIYSPSEDGMRSKIGAWAAGLDMGADETASH